MTFRIKNWKLSLLGLVLMGVFIKLGLWQLSRAQEKTLLLNTLAERRHQSVSIADLRSTKDIRFYQLSIQGYFDNAHSFLLDNKILNGRVGYELYTPFHADGMDEAILVDRGFIPMGDRRTILPKPAMMTGKRAVNGIITLPPTYFSLGSIHDATQPNWPLRIEFVQLNQLSQILGYPLFSFILNEDPHLQIVTMGPERHKGYAVQWFALAFTLLILFVVLNRDRTH